jgi:hypothetical protein
VLFWGDRLKVQIFLNNGEILTRDTKMALVVPES